MPGSGKTVSQPEKVWLAVSAEPRCLHVVSVFHNLPDCGSAFGVEDGILAAQAAGAIQEWLCRHSVMFAQVRRTNAASLTKYAVALTDKHVSLS